MSNTYELEIKPRSLWLDLGIVVVTTLCGTIILALLDTFERLHVFFEGHENAKLDDVFLGLGVLALSLIWFFFSRWRNNIGRSAAMLRAEIKVREQAENALRASEERLRDAIENIPEGFLLTDADDRVVLYNERYRDMNEDVAHLLQPGVKFETLVRDAMSRRRIGSLEGELWAEERLAQYREGTAPSDELHSDGRWIRVEGRRTRDGGYVGLRTDITELKESQRLLYDAIETISEGFALYDADERLVMCNQPYRDTLPRLAPLGLLTPGTKLEDIIGAGIKQGFTPSAYSDAEDYLTKRLEQFRGSTGPFEYETTGGLWIHTEEKKTLNGATVAIRTNITERKRAEEALKESEALLRSFIDNSPSAIFLKDPEGRYKLANKRFGEWFEKLPAEIIDKNSFDLFPEDIAKRFIARDQTVLDKREGSEREVELPFADGQQRMIHFNKFPVSRADGAIIGVGVIGTDITERKISEKALKDSQELFKSIIDNVPSAIVLKDHEGRLSLVNRRFEEWYGVAADDAIGRTTHELFPENFATTVAVQDRGTPLSGKAESVEVEADVSFADNTVHRIASTNFLVPSSVDGSPVVATISTDITQQRKSDEQLRQAQKMEAVGQLTGGVAHDFNNLLGVIIGNLDFLDELLVDDSDQQELIATALQAALQGAEMTSRLLAFSRKQALNPVSIDLNTLVHGMTDLLKRALGETVTIRNVTSPNLKIVKIDSGQLETALLNLAVNARQAMTGGGQLTIETSNVELDHDYAEYHEEVEAGIYAMLAVSDTGTGMSSTVLEHAFDPFFTTKEVGQGSGLGLSMVFGFMKQSNGHISIYSEEDEGTTVKLYFPASEAVEPLSVGQSEPNAIPLGSGEIVLIVEDNAGLRNLAVKIVSSLGYKTVEASDASSALAILDGGAPVDVLFTDIVLPRGMNGARLAAAALARRPSIRVLYTSGYTENAIVHNGVLDEGIELLDKPYRREEVARRLNQILEEK